jgi:protein phosphatase
MRIGSAAGVTDTGRRRLRNEDAFVCRPPLFAVADGMGGARAGEVAAEIAAAALEEGALDAGGTAALVELITEANRRIWERSATDPATAGMGAVVTAALVGDEGRVALGHVGDSRAYLLRDGEIEQLTTDHSLVAELVESGVLTPEEAENHPQRSAITRALGTEPAVEVDAFTVDGRAGDVFLICSDGLSTMVADTEVASLVAAANGDLTRAADELVAAANAGGGVDNVTVVLFELAEGEPDAYEDTARVDSEAATVVEGEVVTAEEEAPAGEPGAAVEAARHGAGAGGRIWALALIVGVVVVAVLALYWGITR